MAMLLRRENDLAVLRIRLTRGGSAPQALFEFQVGTGEPVPLASCPTTALGLSGESDHELARLDDVGALPPDLVSALEAHAGLLGARPSVWLEIPDPCGYLPFLPWEAWLVPVLGRAVLRLPYFLLRPRAAQETLDVVLCATSPRAKVGFDAGRAALELSRTITEAVPRRVTLHLFTDLDVYHWLVDRRSDLPEGTVVHDPAEAEQYSLPGRRVAVDDSADLTNPWLLWIRDALGGGVDVLHFICHGYSGSDRGALALASSPLVDTDRRYARFVGLGQVSSLMNQVGAWSFAVSGPPTNYSQAGLRELGDSIARNAPGFVLVHDGSLGNGFEDVGQAYAFLYQASGPASVPPPAARSLTCWAHPRLVDEYPDARLGTSPGDDLLADDFCSAVFSETTDRMMAAPETPQWLASSARLVEQVQASWFDAGEGTEPAGVRVAVSDAEEALRNVAALLERHAAATSPYGQAADDGSSSDGPSPDDAAAPRGEASA